MKIFSLVGFNDILSTWKAINVERYEGKAVYNELEKYRENIGCDLN